MEMTKQQAGVMKALKQGNEALKRAQQEVSCIMDLLVYLAAAAALPLLLLLLALTCDARCLCSSRLTLPR
jgi:hypothetical protein